VTELKLGKKRTTRDPRTLRFAKYIVDINALEAQMPRTWNAYHAVETTQHEPWPMYGNDTLGDCVPVAWAHMVETWQANSQQKNVDVSDQAIIDAYWAVSGGRGLAPTSYDDYARNYPFYDSGLDPLEFLKYAQKTGLGGHKAGAYVQVDSANPRELRLAAWLTDGLFVGLELPIGLRKALEADPNAAWVMRSRSLTGDWEPGSWGGHMVDAVYANPDGGYLISWGQRFRYSWTFLRAFADVIFAVLSEDSLNRGGVARSGFAYEELLADLNALR
jgi:hypothetical protein